MGLKGFLEGCYKGVSFEFWVGREECSTTKKQQQKMPCCPRSGTEIIKQWLCNIFLIWAVVYHLLSVVNVCIHQSNEKYKNKAKRQSLKSTNSAVSGLLLSIKCLHAPSVFGIRWNILTTPVCFSFPYAYAFGHLLNWCFGVTQIHRIKIQPKVSLIVYSEITEWTCWCL